MIKKLITFNEIEYQKHIAQCKNKLEAWGMVSEEIKRLIVLPVTKNQYELMLLDPIKYVTEAIEAKHRPHITIPVSTEKLFELLEINLSPLKAWVVKYSKFKGKLVWVSSNEVTYIANKEPFRVYAETVKELAKLEATNRLIQAYNDFMKLEEPDFPKYSNHKLHELRQATGNMIAWENGKLVPFDYWIKKN